MGERIASSAAKHPIGHRISSRTLASSDQRYFEILTKNYIVPKYITKSGRESCQGQLNYQSDSGVRNGIGPLAHKAHCDAPESRLTEILI